MAPKNITYCFYNIKKFQKIKCVDLPDGKIMAFTRSGHGQNDPHKYFIGAFLSLPLKKGPVIQNQVIDHVMLVWHYKQA